MLKDLKLQECNLFEDSMGFDNPHAIEDTSELPSTETPFALDEEANTNACESEKPESITSSSDFTKSLIPSQLCKLESIGFYDFVDKPRERNNSFSYDVQVSANVAG